MEQLDVANSGLVWRVIGIMAVTSSCAGGTAPKPAPQTPVIDAQGFALQSEMDLVASTCLADGGRESKVYDARKFYPWVSVGRLYGVVSRSRPSRLCRSLWKR
jgi:hypothetical protein